MEAARKQDAFPFSGFDPDVLVVGSGPVGMRFTRVLCESGYEGRVAVFGDEPWQPYDRVSLSAFLAREMRHDALFVPQNLERFRQARVAAETRITAIDRTHRTIVDASGARYPWRKLVLATGSRPNVPNIPGTELDAVFVFRSLSDAQALLARQLRSRSTVVIGGGLLGLEAARAMLRFNTSVHVVEHEPRLMFRQLDETASELLREHVERIGIRVHTGASVQQIVGNYTPSGVRLRDGTEIECDTVIISAGIRPNIELALDAGLAIGRGIRVDDSMRTSDPDIYAIGECCEHRDQIYGLVGPGVEQAAVAASSIAGKPANYQGSIASTQLKVVGCSVFSLGDVEDSARPYRSYEFRDDDIYRRINVYRGRLVGAVGFGSWDVSRLRNLGIEGRRVWPWQLFNFRRKGQLWLNETTARVSAWPAATTVCSCRGVSRGQLTEAIEAGAATVEALAEATSASTVCGSCKPLLRSLTGGPAEPMGWRSRAMLALSVAGIAVVLLALFLSLPYAGTMSPGFVWDSIWTNSLYKQISGFSLLGLSVLLAVITLRKRLPGFRFGRFDSWQLLHIALGAIALTALLVHTGFRFGANLNSWLMACYCGLLLSGAGSGLVTALADKLIPQSGLSLRSVTLWAHILLLWPLPALLFFHVYKSYYF